MKKINRRRSASIEEDYNVIDDDEESRPTHYHRSPPSSPQQEGGGRRRHVVRTKTKKKIPFRSSNFPLHNNINDIYITNTCNNFLLGGQYYPGKDKKSQYRKTLWYRMFCSSSIRILITIFILSYLLLWYIFLPGIESTLEFGRMISSSSGNIDNDFLPITIKKMNTGPTSFNVDDDGEKRKEKEWKELKRIKDEIKNELGGDGRTKRMKLLERLVPGWYHRNDEKTITNNDGKNSNNPRNPDTASVKDGDSIINNDNNDREIDKNDDEVQRKDAGEKDNLNGINNEEEVKEELRENEKVILEPSKSLKNDSQKEKRKEKSQKSIRESKKKSLQDLLFEEEVKEKETKREVHSKKGASSFSGKDNRIVLMREKNKDKRELLTISTMDTIPSKSQCPTITSGNNDNDTNIDEKIITYNITLVIQCSLDRLWVINETCHRWRDPITVVVHYLAENEEEGSSFVDISKLVLNDRIDITTLISQCPQMKLLMNLAQSDDDNEKWKYPINRLRNIGLDTVQTSHVLIIDVDFIPSMDLDVLIQQALTQRKSMRQKQQKQQQQQLKNDESMYIIPEEDYDAIVIPAFEKIKGEKNSDSSLLDKFPKTKDELRDCVSSQNCTVFQKDNNWEGHYSTHSNDWLHDKNLYEETNSTERKNKIIRSIPCFDSLRYEPYVVIPWCPRSRNNNKSVTSPLSPYYDERFYGYGKNKIQYISHLRFLRYQFSVIPDGFIVHHYHEESIAKQNWNNINLHSSNINKSYIHEEMDKLYTNYLQELISKYKGTILLSSSSEKNSQNNNDKNNNTIGERKKIPPPFVANCS